MNIASKEFHKHTELTETLMMYVNKVIMSDGVPDSEDKSYWYVMGQNGDWEKTIPLYPKIPKEIFNYSIWQYMGTLLFNDIQPLWQWCIIVLWVSKHVDGHRALAVWEAIKGAFWRSKIIAVKVESPAKWNQDEFPWPASFIWYIW